VRWYQADDRMPEDPPAVLKATAAWRNSSDVLLRYIDDRLAFAVGHHVMATELFEDFNDWLEDNGHRKWSDQSFTRRLSQHSHVRANGVEKKRTRSTARLILSQRPRSGHGGSAATTGSALPQQYQAWVGLRFRTSEDDSDVDD